LNSHNKAANKAARMRVDFYIIPLAAPNTRAMFTCKLVQTARRQGQRVYILTQNAAQTRYLDQLLWTFQDDSFIAHDIYPDVADEIAPVRLGHGECNCPGLDVLLNLSAQVPSFYQDYARILEIVSDEAGIRARAREHYRFYQGQGCELHSHDIPVGQ
jgi:DNA polymerase III subunit chi